MALFVLPLAGHCLEQWQQLRAERARLGEGGTPAEIGRLSARYEALKRRFAAEALRLPGQGEMSTILSAVQQAAARSEVRLAALRPGERVRLATHDERTLEVRLAGSFASIAAFLYAVERAPELMSVRGVQVGAGEADGRSLSATVQVRVVTARAAAPDAAAPDAATTDAAVPGAPASDNAPAPGAQTVSAHEVSAHEVSAHENQFALR